MSNLVFVSVRQTQRNMAHGFKCFGDFKGDLLVEHIPQTAAICIFKDQVVFAVLLIDQI